MKCYPSNQATNYIGSDPIEVAIPKDTCGIITDTTIYAITDSGEPRRPIGNGVFMVFRPKEVFLAVFK